MTTMAATERQISYLDSLTHKAFVAIQIEDSRTLPSDGAYTSDHAANYLRSLDPKTAGRCWATTQFGRSALRSAVIDAATAEQLTAEETRAQILVAWTAWIEAVATAITNTNELTSTEASAMIDLLK